MGHSNENRNDNDNNDTNNNANRDDASVGITFAANYSTRQRLCELTNKSRDDGALAQAMYDVGVAYLFHAWFMDARFGERAVVLEGSCADVK